MKRIGSTAERLSRKPYERRVCRIETYPPYDNQHCDASGCFYVPQGPSTDYTHKCSGDYTPNCGAIDF